jgi:hypothetical protein
MSPATIKRTLGLQVKFPNFCPILTKSGTAPNIKFHTNLSSGNRADNSGQAGRQAGRWASRSKQMIFATYMNLPKNDAMQLLVHRKTILNLFH